MVWIATLIATRESMIQREMAPIFFMSGIPATHPLPPEKFFDAVIRHSAAACTMKNDAMF
jgi:hypothetical protein